MDVNNRYSQGAVVVNRLSNFQLVMIKAVGSVIKIHIKKRCCSDTWQQWFIALSSNSSKQGLISKWPTLRAAVIMDPSVRLSPRTRANKSSRKSRWQLNAEAYEPTFCYPFTLKSDQISLQSHQKHYIRTVWRTKLFKAYSDERWLYYQFSLPQYTLLFQWLGECTFWHQGWLGLVYWLKLFQSAKSDVRNHDELSLFQMNHLTYAKSFTKVGEIVRIVSIIIIWVSNEKLRSSYYFVGGGGGARGIWNWPLLGVKCLSCLDVCLNTSVMANFLCNICNGNTAFLRSSSQHSYGFLAGRKTGQTAACVRAPISVAGHSRVIKYKFPLEASPEM